MRTFVFLCKVDGTYNQTQAIFANKATINTVGVFLHKYVCMCMQHETDGALPPTMDFAISNSFWLMSPLLYPSSQESSPATPLLLYMVVHHEFCCRRHHLVEATKLDNG